MPRDLSITANHVARALAIVNLLAHCDPVSPTGACEDDACALCDAELWEKAVDSHDPTSHRPDCPWRQAKALLDA